MYCVRLSTCLFYLFCFTYVKSDECITYDFQNNINSLFINDKGMCAGRDYLSWEVRKYCNIEINSPHHESTTHISAPVTWGCGSTFEFSMTGSGTITTAPSGIIEAKVYLDFNSTSGYIIMDAVVVTPNGNDIMVSEASVAFYDNNVVTGWQTLRINRIGRFGTFRGYVTFLGRGGANSLILVDSFRYIPPGIDEELCVVYKDSLETETTAETPTDATIPEFTTDSTAEITTSIITGNTDEVVTEPTNEPITKPTPAITTESTEAIITETQSTTTKTLHTTTDTNEGNEKCVTFNFESHYDILFSYETSLCEELLPWKLENYTTINTKSPDPKSTVFITPHEDISCISSKVFKMDAGGTIEAKVFMEPMQYVDHIIIQAYKVTNNEIDTIAGFILYHEANEAFILGWNVILFTLLDIESFDGYIVFIGSAAQNSTVLVDSIRYIPPLTPAEDSSCDIY